MTQLLIAAGSSLVTLLITYLLNRRKNKAETELNEVRAIKEVVEIYRESFDSLKAELHQAREEINKLREEVKKLTTLNHKLDCELKAIRRMQNENK